MKQKIYENRYDTIRRGCNRTIRNSVGWIRWTGRMGKCVVRIRAPLGDLQVIELRIRRLQVGVLKNARCEGAYIQLSDSVEDRSSDLGRYCGHVTTNSTRLFLRRGPELAIVMDSEVKFAAANPVIFSAQFSILPTRLALDRHHGPPPSSDECLLNCSSRNDRRTCKLVSPGYPGVYPRGITCRMSLESVTGRFKIGGVLEDSFNLMNYTSQDGCHTENCEQHVEVNSAHKSILSNKEEPRLIRSLKSLDQDEEDEIIIGQDVRQVQRPLRIRNHKKNVKGIRHRKKLSELKMRKSYGRTQSKRMGHKRTSDADNSNWRGGDLEFDRFNSNGMSQIQSGDVRHSIHSQRHKDSDNHHESTTMKFLDENIFDNEDTYEKLSFQSEGNSRALNTYLDDRSEDSVRLKNGMERAHKGLNHERMNPLFEQRFLRRHNMHEKLEMPACIGDYLALHENVNGKIFEISKFCGEGHFPHIVSRGGNVIIEFFTERDGTIMHDGFQLTLQETEPAEVNYKKSCEFFYRSFDRPRDNVKSLQSWYPPNTLCSYRFLGKTSEKVFIQLKIVRNELNDDLEIDHRKNVSLKYCSGNEIAIYSGLNSNDSLMWSYCDISHSDINNIQVPVTSIGNSLLIQYYSAKGSFSGQEFTYTISYKFMKKLQTGTRKKSALFNDPKVISLRPVNFSALNLTDHENCNCDISNRIGAFKSWFMVLVVLGVISFSGAVLTIVTLLTKCMKVRSIEKKMLQTAKQ
ncbi:uncharacterized protein LOC107268367 isoform X2 [Cephus cinctus]|uniref:Uncharacterized protein LOC107268367 isoform X2 n=1 Tax=Cephus cinctus TaxID=211228 RepID=A0AAJ7RHM6_CEPCN|nr:uncharacterized protein LOC107268367 isoform X2 [Cephus cinctus]